MLSQLLIWEKQKTLAALQQERHDALASGHIQIMEQSTSQLTDVLEDCLRVLKHKLRVLNLVQVEGSRIQHISQPGTRPGFQYVGLKMNVRAR